MIWFGFNEAIEKSKDSFNPIPTIEVKEDFQICFKNNSSISIKKNLIFKLYKNTQKNFSINL